MIGKEVRYLSLNELMISLSVLYGIILMILQKIENLTQLSFTEGKQNLSEVSLQTTLYNLKKLQKTLSSSSPFLINKQTPSTTIQDCHNAHDQQSNNLQISNTKSIWKGNAFKGNRTSRQKATNKLDNRTVKTLYQASSQKVREKKEKSVAVPSRKNIGSNFRLRKTQTKKWIPTLPKHQRFFEDQQLEIDEAVIEKIGLYEASNVFKAANVTKFLKQKQPNKLKPVINLKFSSLATCKRNQFFLTENAQIPISEEESESDHLACRNIGQESEQTLCVESQKESGQSGEYSGQQLKGGNLIRKTEWVLTFDGYEVRKDEEYFMLKTQNLSDWGEVSFILWEVQKYLKKVKISHLSFKFESKRFLRQFWQCRKINQKQLQKLLRIKMKVRENNTEEIKIKRLYNSRAEIIRQIVRIWRDRKNLALCRKKKNKRKQIIQWICLRMIVRHRIKKQKQEVLKIVRDMNSKLMAGTWNYEVQIYLPSFSEDQFIRNTTQYMESYENMFYSIWRNSEKHIVLILPAINENILSFIRERTKINKNVTIICPDTHDLYPKALPLAACLLYSNEAILKVKAILNGKKGIIIPGRQITQDNCYELTLSNILNCPLYASLNDGNSSYKIKKDIEEYLPTIVSSRIQPSSDYSHLISKLSILIAENPLVRTWVFKIEGEFNGRGIASFEVSSSKKLLGILQLQHIDKLRNSRKAAEQMKKQTKKLVEDYLHTYFRLKLQVNFENTIFRTQEFIDQLLLKGGCIDEFIEDAETYEFCFMVNQGSTPQVEWLTVCQNFSVDFVTRSSIFSYQFMEKFAEQMKKIEQMLLNNDFLGYGSLILLFCPKTDRSFGLELKPYLTANSGISFFINSLRGSNRKSDTLDPNFNEDPKNSIVFLFIPAIIFTDIDEETRCQIIQQLTINSWESLPNKLFTSPIVSRSPDSICNSFYLSLGLTLGLLLSGKAYDLRKIKKIGTESLRLLSERANGIQLKSPLQQRRDVFQISDVIRSVTRIRL